MPDSVAPRRTTTVLLSVLPLTVLALSAFALACTDPKPGLQSARSDPGAPAVVEGRRVVLPGDTAKKISANSAPAPSVTLEEARRRTSIDFAVLGSAITFGDGRMVAATYASDALLTTPDSVLRGAAQIAAALVTLGRDKSLRNFQRRSTFTRVLDSTVVDSGLYSIVTKRTSADSVLESGRYATTWRVRPSPDNWVILKDRLYRQSLRRGK